MNRVLVIGTVGLAGVAALLAAGLARASSGEPAADDAAPTDGGGDAFSLPEWVPSFGAGAVTGGNADANVAAFLAMIRKAEGTAGPDGYRMMFGGKLFDSYADHPRQSFTFKQTDGRTNTTTAAGAYQFLASTWDDLKRRLGLPDFSPASQDAAAVELIRQRGALLDVQRGNFTAAVSKVATIWASLPGSPYAQNTRSADFVRTAYIDAGGTFA